MNRVNSTFRLTALSAVLVASLASPVRGEDDESTVPESSVTFGVGNWSVDRTQQGAFDGMRDHDAYGLIDLDINKLDSATGTWFTLKTQNLGLESREIRLDALRQGDIGGFLEYSRTPYDSPFTVRTGLQGFGTSRQIVNGTATPADPTDHTLGTVRNMIHAGFYKNLFPDLDFKIDLKSEEKTGTRAYGYGSAALFLTEPIDSTTRQLETMLQYSGANLQLSGGYYGSWFDQDNGGMITATTGASPTATYLSQPLSNQAHQVFLDGGYSFTPTSRATFKVAYTHATQDEHLPVWDVEHLAGVPSSLDGKVNTTLVQLGFSARPLPRLSFTAQARYYDMNDKTPVRQYVDTATDVWNTPQSFTKTSGKVEATYRLPRNYSLVGGVEYYTQDRSIPGIGDLYVPFRSRVDEITYKIQVRRAMSDTVNGSIAYLYSDRTGSPVTESDEGDPQNLVNPVNIADRTRDKVRGSVSWDPTERYSLQFVAERARDNYGPDHNPYGLTRGESWLCSLDSTYAFNDSWNLTGWYSYEDMKSWQDTMRTAGLNEVHLGEITNSFGFGLQGKITTKFTMGADVEQSRSVSRYEQSAAMFSATFRPLPEVTNRLTRYELYGIYDVDRNASVRVDLGYERWHSDDWTWEFANGTPYIYGTTNDGTTLLVDPNQNSVYISAQFTCRF